MGNGQRLPILEDIPILKRRRSVFNQELFIYEFSGIETVGEWVRKNPHSVIDRKVYPLHGIYLWGQKLYSGKYSIHLYDRRDYSGGSRAICLGKVFEELSHEELAKLSKEDFDILFSIKS